MVAQAGLFVARDAGGNGTTAKAVRNALAGLLAKNADGTVRTGVLADGQGAVVSGAAGMSYSVRKHVAVTKASEANGPVLVPNDGTVSVSTDPAPGSNSRIDVIYVWQRLVSGDGGSETTVAPVIDVAKGAASAVPSAPSIPGGALELARVTVPAGTVATSGLTFTPGSWTVPLGSPIPVRSQAERDAVGGYDGLMVSRLDTDVMERHNGSAWKVVDQVYSTVPTPTVDGNVSGPSSNPIVRKLNWVSDTTTSAGLVTVVFPTPFANGIIHAVATTISGAGVNPVVNASAISKTSVTFIFPGVLNTAVKFSYEAVGW